MACRIVSRLLALALAALAPANRADAQGPEAISPGQLNGVGSIGDRCPSFSWSTATGVRGYELVVLEAPGDGAVDDHEADREPVLHESLPAGASSWTPSLDRALETGRTYAWFVRAFDTHGQGEWSRGRFFEVAAAPSADEVSRAIDVLKRHLKQASDGAPGGLALELVTVDRISRQRAGSAHSSSDAERDEDSEGEGGIGKIASPLLAAGEAAVRAIAPDTTGVSYGVVGVSHSPSGAGLAADNTAGGPDLVLGGPSASLAMTETGIDVASVSARTFEIRNSLGGMSLEVQGNPVYHTGNDGPTSGLNADLLDSLHASSFLRSDASTTFSGPNLTFASGSRLGIAAGSVSAPGLYLGAGTTGIYSPAPDTLAFSSGGFPALTIHPDGALEIGGAGENLRWDNVQGRFEFSRSLAIAGAFQAGDTLGTSLAYNRFGSASTTHSEITNASDLLIGEDLEVDGRLFVQHLIQVGSPSGDAVAYNRFGSGTASHALISSNEDVLVSGDLEINGSVFLDGGYGCGVYTPANFCPAGNLDGEPCDQVPPGSYCEADTECVLDTSLDNCGSFDWYFRSR